MKRRIEPPVEKLHPPELHVEYPVPIPTVSMIIYAFINCILVLVFIY